MEASKEAFEQYLPHYLSGDKKTSLKKALKDFRESRFVDFYQSAGDTQADILQGDVWTPFKFYEYDTGKERKVKGIVLSNTCDVSDENIRQLPVKLNFAPVISLDKFIAVLSSSGVPPTAIASKLHSIKRQEITNIFYLPECKECNFKESIVPLYDLHSVPVERLREDESFKRIKSLSMFGFYLFTFKLSIHFCRLHEGVNRV